MVRYSTKCGFTYIKATSTSCCLRAKILLLRSTDGRAQRPALAWRYIAKAREE